MWKKGIVLLLKVNSQECPAPGPCGQTVLGWAEWDAECPTYCGCYMSDLLGSSDTSLGKRLLQDLKPSNYVRFTHLLWSWSLPSLFMYWLVCPVGLCRMNSDRKEAVGLVQIFYSSLLSKHAWNCAYPCSAVWEYVKDVLPGQGFAGWNFQFVCLVLSWREGGKAHCVARGETEMVSNSCLGSWWGVCFLIGSFPAYFLRNHMEKRKMPN